VVRVRTSILLFLTEELVDLLANFTLRHLDIILGGTIVGHERQESVIGNVELSPVRFSPEWTTCMRLVLTNWYSRRVTFGTSMLWVDGDRSSNFLPVKMSRATKWTLA